jgi:photosystem II stability/assembly factor-like uncharacterized protein
MVLLVLVALGAQVTRAQEDAAPEYAVKAPLASRSLMLDAAAADGALVAVGGRGHILISEDDGETWTQAEVPTRAALTGVFFHDRNLGWVVGHDAVVLRTTDGGGTWERVHWAPEEESPFFDIWFADADNGRCLWQLLCDHRRRIDLELRAGRRIRLSWPPKPA